MIVCDYIIANFDKHYRNFGVIRNVETLEWIKIAPIFDNGSSLWATTPTTRIGSGYKSNPFVSTPKNQLDLVKDLGWLDLDRLDYFPDIVAYILRKTPLIDEIKVNEIYRSVALRIEQVKEKKHELTRNNEMIHNE